MKLVIDFQKLRNKLKEIIAHFANIKLALSSLYNSRKLNSIGESFMVWDDANRFTNKNFLTINDEIVFKCRRKLKPYWKNFLWGTAWFMQERLWKLHTYLNAIQFFPNFQFKNNTLPDISVDFSLQFKLLQFAPIIWFLRAWNIDYRWVYSTWFVLIVWYFQGGLNMRTEETRNTRTIYLFFLWLLFEPNNLRGGYRTAATSKMERFVLPSWMLQQS